MTGTGERTADGSADSSSSADSADDEEQPLRLRWTEHGVVVEACGEFDLANAKEIRGTLAGVLRDAPNVIVVCLTGVTFISSVGLSLLVEANALAGPGTLRLVTGGEVVQRAIELTGLDSVLPVYDSVEAALTAT